MCRRVVVFGNEPLVTIRLHQACPLVRAKRTSCEYCFTSVLDPNRK
jgi:hypothetical protein